MSKATKITLYTIDHSSPCGKARKFLAEIGVEYELKDVQESEEHMNEMKEAGFTSVPTIRIQYDNGSEQWLNATYYEQVKRALK